MRKQVAALLSIVLIISFSVNANAAIKTGDSCNKLGKSTIYSGKKYICIKSGKKFIWNKGTLISPKVKSSAAPSMAPTIETSPSPSASSAVLKATIPISLPINQNGKITFANAANNYAQISQIAWQNVQDAIAANQEVKIPTFIEIGPNTKASLEAISAGIDRGNRLFAGFLHFPQYGVVVHNAKDEKWAEATAANLFNQMGIKGAFARSENISRIIQGNCEMNGSIAVNCGGGMAINFKDANDFSGFTYHGVETGNGDFWTDANKYVGPMTQVNHELTHNYQFAQFTYTPMKAGENIAADQSHNFTPWWFSEGQANAIGVSTFIDNLKDYQRVRDNLVTAFPGQNVKLPAFTSESLKIFLTTSQETGPQNPNWLLSYSIGFATVEALIAIGGPKSTMALYALGANGDNWETAFKKVYGITWDEGSTYLSQILVAEYAAKPMNK